MAYREEVLADLPYRYFRLGGTGAATDETGSGAALTFGAATAAPTRNVAGALAGAQNDGAVQFDGVNDTATVPLDLSTTDKVTIEMWLWWDAFANNDQLAMEFTGNANNSPGAFIINPNASGGAGVGGTFHFAHNGSPNAAQACSGNFARPSAAAWHHVVLYIWRNGSTGADHTKAYVDGAAVPVTIGLYTLASSIGNGNFANSTLYIMHRSTPGLWGAGRLDELAIYTTELSAARVLAHYNAGLAAGGATLPQALTVAATGSPSLLKRVGTNLTRSATVGPAISKRVGTTLARPATGSPVVVKSVGTLLTRPASGAPTIAKRVGKPISQGVTGAPSVTRLVRTTISRVVTSGVSVLRRLPQALSVTVTGAPATLRRLPQSLSVTANSVPSVVASKVFLRALTVTATNTLSLVRRIGKNFNPPAVTTTQTTTKQVRKPVPVAVAASPSVVKRIARTVAVTATGLASLAAQRVQSLILVTMTATATSSVSIVRRVGVGVAASATSAVTLAKSIALRLGVAAITTPGLRRLHPRSLQVSATGALSVVALRVGSLVLPATLTLRRASRTVVHALRNLRVVNDVLETTITIEASRVSVETRGLTIRSLANDDLVLTPATSATSHVRTG